MCVRLEFHCQSRAVLKSDSSLVEFSSHSAAADFWKTADSWYNSTKTTVSNDQQQETNEEEDTSIEDEKIKLNDKLLLPEQPQPQSLQRENEGDTEEAQSVKETLSALPKLRFEWGRLELHSPLAKRFAAHQGNCSAPMGKFIYRNQCTYLIRRIHIHGRNQFY